MSPESKKSTVLIHQKILLQLKQFEKNFTEKSKPLFLDKVGEKISLKEIYDLESTNDKPISLIAVTRHQYNISNFSTYENYIQNNLSYERIYYGVWPDSENKKIEYDVLYVIPTDSYDEVQKHLNLHDKMNQGIPQKMALVIFSDGNSKIIENFKI